MIEYSTLAGTDPAGTAVKRTQGRVQVILMQNPFTWWETTQRWTSLAPIVQESHGVQYWCAQGCFKAMVTPTHALLQS